MEDIVLTSKRNEEQGGYSHTLTDAHGCITAEKADSSATGEEAIWLASESALLYLTRSRVRALLPLLEHFDRFGCLPTPTQDAPDFQVDDIVACAGEAEDVFRIAKIWHGTESKTGSAYLVKVKRSRGKHFDFVSDHGVEDFRKLRKLEL